MLSSGEKVPIVLDPEAAPFEERGIHVPSMVHHRTGLSVLFRVAGRASSCHVGRPWGTWTARVSSERDRAIVGFANPLVPPLRVRADTASRVGEVELQI